MHPETPTAETATEQPQTPPGELDDAAFPQGLEIDYVRVYQKNVDVSQSAIGKDLCPSHGC